MAGPDPSRPLRLAVVSTTIRGEGGFLPFDRLAAESPFSEVRFFVAGDLGARRFDTARFRCPVDHLEPAGQARFLCSEEIGWRSIQRRNTALLTAIAWAPDYILLVDDDNVPPPDYFEVWHRTLTEPKDRVLASSDGGEAWFNYLETADFHPTVVPRGFPLSRRPGARVRVTATPEPVPADRVGLFQGISLGDPDVDAMTRIACAPRIEHVKQKNYLVRELFSPYNSQNTVLAPCLFPLGFVWPHCGRYDDIYASFAWQAFLFDAGCWVHVGDAMNRQERGPRDLVRDLEGEIEGYRMAESVFEAVRACHASDARRFLARLAEARNHEILERIRPFLSAFLADLEAIAG